MEGQRWPFVVFIVLLVALHFLLREIWVDGEKWVSHERGGLGGCGARILSMA